MKPPKPHLRRSIKPSHKMNSLRPLLPLILLPFIPLLLSLRTPPPPRPASPTYSHQKGVLMSCPHGQSHTHKGSWKPSRMTLGAEAVLRQLVRYNSSLPFFLAYYEREQRFVLPWCRRLAQRYSIDVHCFKVPERYPSGLYGYAKIFAIRYVPVRWVLWLDCDVFPVTDVNYLFGDEEFVKSGAM